MPNYIVMYDLIGEGKDRAPIEKVTADLTWTAQLSESAYLVHSNETAKQLFERYAKHIDDDDRLTVFEVTEAPIFQLPAADLTDVQNILGQ